MRADHPRVCLLVTVTHVVLTLLSFPGTEVFITEVGRGSCASLFSRSPNSPEESMRDKYILGGHVA